MTAAEFLGSVWSPAVPRYLGGRVITAENTQNLSQGSRELSKGGALPGMKTPNSISSTAQDYHALQV